MHQGFKAALGAAAVVCSLAAPAAASAATFTVDDDRQQCKRAQFTSINAAVQAAAPGDEVRVCAGTYPERVLVDKPLELYGPRRANGGANGRDDFPAPPDPRKEAVVVNGGQGGFDVQADDVTVIGFAVLGTGASTYPNPGIYVREGAGRVIEGNVLTRNRLGVYVEGAQQSLEIERNGIFDNSGTVIQPPQANQPNGGIFSAGGPLDDTSVSDNEFIGNGQFAMNFGGGSGGGLVIEHNTSVADGTFLVILNTTDARVAHNHAEDLRGSGVFGLGNNTGLLIEHNELEGVEGNTAGSAMRLFGPETGTIIRFNHGREFGFDGVSLNGVTGALVAHNEMDETANSGYRLQNADDSTFANNRARDNGLSGLRAELQSTGNTIVDNDLRGNGGPDCSDLTAGPGTSGTANVWENDRGDDEDRPGLCVGATLLP